MYVIDNDGIEYFKKVIKDKYPDANPYTIKLIGNTLESKDIIWQDVDGRSLEMYSEIVGIENTNRESEYPTGETASLTEYNPSDENFKNKQIIFKVSYIEGRAVTLYSAFTMLLSPVFICSLIYIVFKLLKNNIKIFK